MSCWGRIVRGRIDEVSSIAQELAAGLNNLVLETTDKYRNKQLPKITFFPLKHFFRGSVKRLVTSQFFDESNFFQTLRL